MSKINKTHIFTLLWALYLIGLQSCDKCECEPCETTMVDTTPESALTVTYCATKDLIEGVSPVVRLRMNGVVTVQMLSLADFAEADSAWMEYALNLPFEGDSNRMEMVITYVRNDRIPNKGRFSLGRKITAQCRGRNTNQSSATVNGSGQQSYTAALDAIAANGKDSLVFSQNGSDIIINTFFR